MNSGGSLLLTKASHHPSSPLALLNWRTETPHDQPSNRNEAASTTSLTIAFSIGCGFRSRCTPWKIDTPAPSANTSSATMKLQKYSSRPYPAGWSRSAFFFATRIPYSSRSSLPVSTHECTASLSIAELPVNAAAPVLVTATSTLPTNAAQTAVREPAPPPPGSASAISVRAACALAPRRCPR
jgi:hypothetical protein